MIMTNIATNAPEFSVSELSASIKRKLEDDFGNVRVRGEMGRITIARSGHVYVDLKDANAVLSAVMWKGVASSLKFRLDEGMEVIATGKISSFPGSSKYQLIIDRLEPAGVGALLAQLEERKKRLANEGLFEPGRKRPLPFMPAVIGVVTSPTGAVIRDILHRLSDRFPTHVLLWPVLVQGDKAADQVARAITGFNAIALGGVVPRPDLIIVARGGGSIEDLWAFNEEVVVRAAAGSAIPLISAIGHETDTTLIDFASDQRAPTPTGAAEIAVPVRTELQERLSMLGSRLTRGLLRGVERQKIELRAASGRLPRAETLLATPRQRMDLMEARFHPSLRVLITGKTQRLIAIGGRLRPQVLKSDVTRRGVALVGLDQRLQAAMKRRLALAGDRIASDAKSLDVSYVRLKTAMTRTLQQRQASLATKGALLEALSYKATLERGFAVVRTDKGALVRAAAGIKSDARLTITFHDGEVKVRAGDGPIQGSLF
jgi:exodeoxyribonuclease VII large subunit